MLVILLFTVFTKKVFSLILQCISILLGVSNWMISVIDLAVKSYWQSIIVGAHLSECWGGGQMPTSKRKVYPLILEC